MVEPTETEGGYTLHECIYGDDSYKDNFTDPTGTNPPAPDRIQGDVDGDGEITNADLILVARYVVEIYNELKADIEKYGDMDGDGEISNADLIKVARIIVNLD